MSAKQSAELFFGQIGAWLHIMILNTKLKSVSDW